MKFLSVVLIALFFTSCNSNSTKIDNSKKDLSNELKITDNTSIIGSWTMCSYTCGGTNTQFNVCPIILFNYNGTGSVENNNMITENFVWTLKKGILSISHIVQNSNNTFSDTTFMTRFGEKKDEHFLTIIQQTQDCSYYLSR